VLQEKVFNRLQWHLIEAIKDVPTLPEAAARTNPEAEGILTYCLLYWTMTMVLEVASVMAMV
jgi:hypothetical protein